MQYIDILRAPSFMLPQALIPRVTLSTGAVLGAGGVTAYYNGMDFSGAMRHMLTPGWGAGGSPNWPVASSSSREVEELTRLVGR